MIRKLFFVLFCVICFHHCCDAVINLDDYFLYDKQCYQMNKMKLANAIKMNIPGKWKTLYERPSYVVNDCCLFEIKFQRAEIICDKDSVPVYIVLEKNTCSETIVNGAMPNTQDSIDIHNQIILDEYNTLNKTCLECFGKKVNAFNGLLVYRGGNFGLMVEPPYHKDKVEYWKPQVNGKCGIRVVIGNFKF